MSQSPFNKPTPPKWAVRFFNWYSNDHLQDAVMGDMLELYERRYVTLGKRKANLLFIWNVISFVRPFAIRKKSNSSSLNQFAMFQNYFKMAWRTMVRQKMYTTIKIGGFALGLATCMIIALFIRQELSFDKHYKNIDRIYRVYNDFTKPGDGGKWTSFPASMGPILKADYPEVEKSGRLIPYKWFDGGSSLIRRSDEAESTYEEGIAYADQEFLEVLEIPMIYGNPSRALSEPHSIVISKSKSDKYFPNQDPVGKLVVLNDDPSKTYTIGGVFQDFPVNHHLQFDFFLTLKEVEFWPGEQASWCCWNYNVYVLLRPDAKPREFEKKMLAVKDIHYVGHLKETGNQSEAEVAKYHTFKLQPINEIYLTDDLGDNLSHGDKRYIWLFGAVAVFILLLACINFINLSTAKSANRAKEVGLRKVVGSFRNSLINQFLTESILYSFVSFVLAIVIVIVALPSFNAMAGKSLSIPWNMIWLFPLLIISALVIGFIAGIYPSFYLSAFRPIEVLKGSISRGSKSSSLRSAMVVFQFTTSIILIIGTFVIYRQMNFILHTKVGFDKDRVVMIQGTNTLNDKGDTFKNELLKLSEVKGVTSSNYFPVAGTNRDQNGFWKDGKSKEDKAIGAQAWRVDEDYITTMGMKLVEGRNFNRDIKSDSQVVIINQAMVKALGLKNPLEEKIMNWQTFSVIGVVEDFHFESMKGKIGPLCLILGNGGDIVSVKLQQGNTADAMKSITDEWNKLMPHQPIRYTFLDESYARMYEDVERTGNILTSFALLAIFVACLGLFALSAFMVEQRNKEISIRLVLGASVKSIFQLLTQNFVFLVLIAFVIAAPIAWYAMQTWLEDYEYKIEITWDVFLIAGLMAIAIALLTVSYQSIRAALANPVTRLRSE